MTRKLSLIVVALCLTTSSARAAPEVRILPTNDAFHGPCGSSEEDLTLVVSEGGRPIATRDYCSSYGQSSAQVITDRLGRSYVALEFGEGRGTRAVTMFLLIYYLDGDNLQEIARVPISWATGLNGDWIFEYSVDQLQPSGFRITFREFGNGVGDECCTLPERTLTLTVGTP